MQPAFALPIAPAHPRMIVVGVRDIHRDLPALDWVEFDAVPEADVVKVVRAYFPATSDEPSWGLPGMEQPRRRDAALRCAAGAAHQVRVAAPGLHVDYLAPAGLPADVLMQLSTTADLVVLSADTPGTAMGTRHVALRVQENAHCTVVCVPSGFTPTAAAHPVTVVADDTGVSETALTFAGEYACRHQVSVEVAQPWAALHVAGKPSAEFVAYEQEQLDAVLASWRRQFPSVPVAARIELEPHWLPHVAAASGLVVVSAAALSQDQRMADAAWLRCPTAVVR